MTATISHRPPKSACRQAQDDRDDVADPVGARVAPERPRRTTLVIGAGPAGLDRVPARQAGHDVVVLRPIPTRRRPLAHRRVQGVSLRHRRAPLFSKSAQVERWTELLGDELLERPRLSRIYYNGKFFDYPVRAGNAPPQPRPSSRRRSARCRTSRRCSFRSRTRAPSRTGSRINRWRLYRTFFKTYTEKVWG
jgi:hypothetical protein